MPKYFDIHSHLNFPEYREDLEEVVKRLKETETHTIVIGTDLTTSKKAVELAEQHDGIYACIGVHPVNKKNEDFHKEEFEKLVKSTKVVAVGECGLDFFHADKEKDYKRQKEQFLAQMDFALEHDKPIMIHSRNAYEDLLEILKPFKQVHGEKLRGNIHFFAGTLEQASQFWEIGFSTSFTGVITFARDYDEVIRNAPSEMIMAETDAPYVAPVPYRGKRNEPSYVAEVVKKIAEIRGSSFEEARETLVNNALRMIG